MTFRATQSGIRLHHLALTSSDPSGLATFYERAMGMVATPIDDGDWHCNGKDRRLHISPGPDGGLEFAGMACRDSEGLERLRKHLSENRVPMDISPSPWFDSCAFSVVDPDGNRLVFGLAAQEEYIDGLCAPLQHLTFASLDVERWLHFYKSKLGFEITDRVIHSNGSLATAFTTSNHEHHTIACFLSDRAGVDHHSYEAGEWTLIRDWCDHFAAQDIRLMWGPGRHGPGNNLFIFIEDPDHNWIEISAELEVMQGRETKDWPQAERTLNLWGNAIMRS